MATDLFEQNNIDAGPKDLLAGKIDIAPIANDDQQGLLDKIGSNINKRAIQAGQIKQSYGKGEISKPEEVFQLAGKAGAGLVGDISGNLLTSGLQSVNNLTGGYLGNGVSTIMRGVGNLPSIGGGTIGDRLPRELTGIARPVEQGYQDFAAAHPRAATNIESGANLAMTLPGMIGSGESVLSAMGKTGASLKAPQVMSAEEIRKKGSGLFKLAEQQGGNLKPQFMDDYVDEISKMTPQTKIGKAMEGESPVAKMVTSLEPFRGQPLSFESAKEADEILGNLAYKNVDNFGKLDNNGRQFLDMQRTLRNMIEQAPDTAFENGREGFETAKEARKYWAAHLRMRDVERIIENANSYEQPSTAIKSGFRTLLRKAAKNGYSKEEIGAMKKAQKSGLVTDFFKIAGSALGPIGAGVAGGAAAGPLGTLAYFPAYALQQGSKKIANMRQFGRANKVTQAIAKRVQNVPETSFLKEAGDLGLQAGAGLAPAAGISALGDVIQPQIEKSEKFVLPSGIMDRLKEAEQKSFKFPKHSEGQIGDVLRYIKKAESGGDPNAKNPQSTASGLYQFTNTTWKDMVNKYGKKTGISLSDKDSPEAQETMAALFTRDNANSLQDHFGRPPTKGEIYMAHFLGADGAKKLIQAARNDSGTKAASLFKPIVAANNRNIFFNKSRPRTAAEVYELLTSKVT